MPQKFGANPRCISIIWGGLYELLNPAIYEKRRELSRARGAADVSKKFLSS